MAGASDVQWMPKYNPWLIATAVMLATFMEVMDTSIAAVALPYIAGSVSATSDEATWVLTSYLVANAIFIPMSTWLSLKFGRKRYLIASVLIFTAASFACGSANSLAFILIARAIQGAAGGALQPLALAILMESFPPAKRGLAMAMYALGVVVAPVIGPTLGGYLTDHISWRWAFYINIPIGLVAVLMQSRFLEDPPFIKKARPGPLDATGLAFLALFLGSLQYVCDKGQEDDWFGSSLIRWMAIVCIVGFIAWIVRERSAKSPLVDLCIFLNRNFAIGCLLIGLFGACVYGVTTILPLFYQTLLGYDATSAGLAVASRGIGAMVSSAVVGIIVSRVDSRKLIALGFVIFGLTAYWTANITLQIGFWSLFWPTLISGTALGLIFVPLSGTALATLPPEQLGNGSALFNLIRNIGGSIGISAVNTIAQRRVQAHRGELVTSLGGTSLAVQRYIASLTAAMQRHVGPHLAMQRAFARLQATLDGQAQLWAYVDDFRYLALLCGGCVLVVMFLKRTKGSAEPVG
jgi:MFS transporter, DHA2 family, multidrug resistance protein